MDAGGWDYDAHLELSTLNPVTNELECPDPFACDYAYQKLAVEDGTEICAGNIEWCNGIFNQDWYDLYGIDNYVLGNIDIMYGTLSADDIAGMLTGDISASREAFVSYALSQVGKISYYWGGKACDAGEPLYTSISGSGRYPAGTVIRADYKGRNIAGLDCSGFVQWCYWSVFGSKPGGSTATFTSSLGLKQITSSQLKPGDIGLLATPGSQSNHIGIYAGDGKWVHCSSTRGTVLDGGCFHYFYSLGE